MNELEDEEVEDIFVIDRDLEEPDSKGDVQGEAKLRNLPSDLQEQIATFLKAVRKVSPESIPDKRKRDEVSLAAMRRALELRLAQYPTTEADDAALLQQSWLTGRQRMAVVVRHGEKKLLREGIELASEKMNMNGAADSTEHAAKRQRAS
jgi:N-lysine methyltransferase SETD6